MSPERLHVFASRIVHIVLTRYMGFQAQLPLATLRQQPLVAKIIFCPSVRGTCVGSHASPQRLRCPVLINKEKSLQGTTRTLRVASVEGDSDQLLIISIYGEFSMDTVFLIFALLRNDPFLWSLKDP